MSSSPVASRTTHVRDFSAMSSTPEKKIQKGLLGVYADASAISSVGDHGLGLTYRGFQIEDLADKCIFEEVAYLLIYGALPTSGELLEFKARLAKHRQIPPELCTVLEQLGPQAHAMDVLRTTCSTLGCIRPETDKTTPAEVCERLMSSFVSSLCYWHHYTNSKKRITFNVDPKETLASSVLKMFHQDTPAPSEMEIGCIDKAYILYAEHSFAASTFTARVVASTMSDTYSCVAAGIGALRGPLHGGANEAVMYLIEPLKNKEEALALLKSKMAKKELVMGFGHRIYKDGDPRNTVFKKISLNLSKRPNSEEGQRLFEISDAMETLMAKEKKMYPNADFYAASAYHQARVPTPWFTPLFVIARTAGWTAHIQEQRVGNKIIRPNSLYSGPATQEFIPIEKRTKQAKL